MSDDWGASTSSSGDWGEDGFLAEDVHRSASISVWTAIVALSCAMAGPFSCYSTYFLSLPLGVAAAWYGWKALGQAHVLDDGRAVRTSASAGMTGGILATLASGMLLLVVFVVIALYALMFLFAFIAAAASQ